MKAIALCIALLGCSSSPEPVESQTEHWFNTCDLKPWGSTDLQVCSTFYHFTCKDGDSQFLWIPAEGYQWLGTPCYQDSTTTYVYVCVFDSTKGTAEVRCSK